MKRTAAKPIPELALTARRRVILARQAIAGAVVHRSISDREIGSARTVLKVTSATNELLRTQLSADGHRCDG